MTFFVPASLGALEGGNAAAFAAFGWAGSAGLAFTLVRRARQAVWIGLGLTILLAMSTGRVLARGTGEAGPLVDPRGGLGRPPRMSRARPAALFPPRPCLP